MSGHKIGKDVYIGEDIIIIDGLRNEKTIFLKVGNRVSIAPRVTFILYSMPFRQQLESNDALEEGAIVIEDDVWLGTGVIIMPNVTIGKGSIVGAGSVVTKNIPPMTISFGVPAKPRRKRLIIP